MRTVIRDAVSTTPYYAKVLNAIGFDIANFSFDDFARVPVLERRDILRSQDTMISRTIDKALLRPDSSGGSTGEPTKIWVGPEEELWHSTAREFYMRQLGIIPGSRIAYLWGHHLDPVAKNSFKEKISGLINNHRWFDCFRLSPEILGRYHEEMERYQPECIVAYASALVALAQFLFENNLRPSYPRRCIVTGAEKLYDSQREAAENVFRKPIYERYGSRDAGMIGIQQEIPRSRDFIVDWPNLLVEPETTAPDTAILVTKLHADGMPMIRYRTGDVGMFPMGSNPGHPAFRILGVVGRETEKIWLPNGSFIHGIQFPHLFKEFPVREFMVLQAEDYSITVQVVPGPKFAQDSKSSILDMICRNLPGIPVTITLVDYIAKTQANKWRPVVSHVPGRTDSKK
ncbi:MAG TPA: hypothetical protein VKH81_04305 [Candidatus Angelobacter sp.]|nr:hypothetical protein [Candidatus Angelobacter sp.]